MDRKEFARLPELKARKATVSDQLKKLQETKGDVSAETVQQLETQYTEEINQLGPEISDVTAKIQNEQGQLKEKVKELGEAIAAKDKELKEIDVLLQSGALGEEDHKKRAKAINQAKRNAQKELAKSEKDIEWLNQCLTSETPLKSGGIGGKLKGATGKSSVGGNGFLGKILDQLRGRSKKFWIFWVVMLFLFWLITPLIFVAYIALSAYSEDKPAETKAKIRKLSFAGAAGIIGLIVIVGLFGMVFGDKSAYKLAGKYPDAQKRYQKVQKIDNSEDLALVILMDPVEEIRDLALEKIIDPQGVWDVLRRRIERAEDFISIMENCDHGALRAYAVQNIYDRDRLLYYIQNDPSEDVRVAAVKSPMMSSSDLATVCNWWRKNRFKGDGSFYEKHKREAQAAWECLKKDKQAQIDYLASTFINNQDYEVFTNCFEGIEDQKVLASLAKNAKSELIRKNAVEEITSQEALADLVKNSNDETVCIYALKRIKDSGILSSVIEALDTKKVEDYASNERVKDYASTQLASLSYYIEKIRQSTFPDVGKKTTGKAFEDFFTNPKWRAYKSTKDTMLVEFSGDVDLAKYYSSDQLNTGDCQNVRIEFSFGEQESWCITYAHKKGKIGGVEFDGPYKNEELIEFFTNYVYK